MTDLLTVTDLVRGFGGLRAVDGATFSVKERSITALIGPNGAGKTTTLNLISGSISPDSGTIVYHGNAIQGLAAYKVARTGVMRTFQLPRTMAAMTVLDNMLLGSVGHPGESLLRLLAGPRRGRRFEERLHERAAELLSRVGLADQRDALGGTLSGGQRKLLELARLLMAKPRLVLLDEPLAGVNPALGERLMTFIQEIKAGGKTTILFIEHDIAAVMKNSDKIIVMARGKVIASGTPAEIRQNAEVIEAYLGSVTVAQ